MESGGKVIVELELGWSFMQNGIAKLKRILEGLSEEQITSDEYIMLYTTTYNMCTQKQPHDYSQQLYDRYRAVFEEYLGSKVLPSLRTKHNEFMLMELDKWWNLHKVFVRWLSRFFNYLDRYFVHRKSIPGLYAVGLHCFRDVVYADVKNLIKDIVIALVHREREGDRIDRSLLKKVLEMFVEMGMGAMDAYEGDFEKAMLEDSADYYSRKAAFWIDEDSCPEYMIKAEESLKREKERAGNYFHASTESKLVEKVQEELLSRMRNQLLEKEHSGCLALLRNEKVEDLTRMYRLFVKIPLGLDRIADVFRLHVTNEGTALVKEADDDDSRQKSDKKDRHAFVMKLLGLHDKYLQYVRECFNNHSQFYKALKDAFEVFCNKEMAGSTSAEILATFCDNVLKPGGTEKLSDEAIEETLEKVIKILDYISEKDLFVEFYRKKLARRLLFDRNSNEDNERNMLTKLKQQFGGQFTSKMEGMVTDIVLARENQSRFEDSTMGENLSSNHGIDLTVTVLTTGFWPTYKSADLALPVEMVRCIEAFQEYYQTRTKHRKLTWMYSLGTCNIIGKFEPKQIELIVTSFQAAVLLLFNAADRLGYAEVKNQLNLTDEDVIRLLQSLSCEKHKILTKIPSTKTVDHRDYFQFNSKFTDKARRIKIPLPSVDAKKKILEDVDKDRRYAVDACIVRIMKSRKALAHQQLVAECVAQLGKMFKLDLKMIKKRIEDLIAREYMDRDSENPNLYRYRA